MNQEEKEFTINIADMVAHLLHRWKRVFIWGLVFMVIVGGFKSYQDYKGIKSKYEANTYSAMTREMTENQKNNVKNYFSRYENYKKRIEENQNYLDNSLLMDINPNSESVYNVEYIVKTEYQNVMSSFTSSTFDYEDYEKIAKLIGEDAKAEYVNELVTLSGNMEQNSYEIDTDKKGDVINGNISNSYTGILKLEIKANDRSTCEKIADAADEAIRGHLDKVRQAGINVEVSELSTIYMEREDLELSEYQREKIDEGAEIVNEYYQFIADADKTLDEDELKLFKYLIDKDQEVNDTIHWKKWMVVGFGIGFVLATISILINYICIPGVKSYDEVESMISEKEIGIVIQPTKSKILLGKLFHGMAQKMEFHGVTILPETESVPLICNRIEGICKGNETKEVYLINDIKEGYTKGVVDKCIENLKSKGLNANAGNPSCSVDDFMVLKESKGAVAFLVITNKASLPNTVKSNLAVCKENNVKICGSFIVSPQR